MMSRLLLASACLAILAGSAAPFASAQQTPQTARGLSKFSWRKIDEGAVRAAGIRKLESQRLVLFTDLASSPEVDELPAVFDQAFDLWCKYFKLDAEEFSNWRMRASLIDKPQSFAAAGLLPADLPKFYNGYTQNLECWLNNQSSPYYRRHLLLHEGVHGFMFTLLGNNAPPWYVEGMAEHLGTHRWKNGTLQLPYFPRDPQETPKLGRIEIVQNDFAHARAKRFEDVMAYDSKAHLNVEAYGWSWAAVAFLDGHPKYRDRFRKLTKLLPGDRDFNTELKRAYGGEFDQLREEWQVFVADIDYGYDFSRAFLDFKPGKPLTGNHAEISVVADRGWQNSGWRLEPGHTYQLNATGSYQVAHEGRPWLSEPAGISIRYVRGRPLGQLLAVIHPDRPLDGASPFLKPTVVGVEATLIPAESGTLYLKINDSAGALDDNKGKLDVQLKAE